MNGTARGGRRAQVAYGRYAALVAGALDSHRPASDPALPETTVPASTAHGRSVDEVVAGGPLDDLTAAIRAAVRAAAHAVRPASVVLPTLLAVRPYGPDAPLRAPVGEGRLDRRG